MQGIILNYSTQPTIKDLTDSHTQRTSPLPAQTWLLSSHTDPKEQMKDTRNFSSFFLLHFYLKTSIPRKLEAEKKNLASQ